MKKTFLLLLVFVSTTVAAQTRPAFWQDIQKFRQQDSLQTPPRRPILFIGSSSFTRWTDVQRDFPGYPILNRAFGGSTLPDLIRYEDDVIFKYRPKQIVIFCGDNDLAASNAVTADTVFSRFRKLLSDIRAVLPKVPVAYVSIKPSPSRAQLIEKQLRTNGLIAAYLSKQKHAAFINVWDAMMTADKKIREDLFVEDNLHMNGRGYAIWQTIIQPYLRK